MDLADVGGLFDPLGEFLREVAVLETSGGSKDADGARDRSVLGLDRDTDAADAHELFLPLEGVALLPDSLEFLAQVRPGKQRRGGVRREVDLVEGSVLYP